MELIKNEDGSYKIVNISHKDLDELNDCLFAGKHEGFDYESTEKLRLDIEKYIGE